MEGAGARLKAAEFSLTSASPAPASPGQDHDYYVISRQVLNDLGGEWEAGPRWIIRPDWVSRAEMGEGLMTPRSSSFLKRFCSILSGIVGHSKPEV